MRRVLPLSSDRKGRKIGQGREGYPLTSFERQFSHIIRAANLPPPTPPPSRPSRAADARSAARGSVSRGSLDGNRQFSGRTKGGAYYCGRNGQVVSDRAAGAVASGVRSFCGSRGTGSRALPRDGVIRPLRVLVCFTLLVRGLGRARNRLARIRSPLTQGTRALYGISYPASFAP